MCLLSVWKPHILSFRSSGYDQQYDQIPFEMVDTNCFVQGIPIHPPDPNVFLYTDGSHFRWGAHLEPMSLSFHGRWLVDQSQLYINMLEIMAIHFALIRALKHIHHSCVSGLIYQQARRNTFSQPLCRGMEDPKTTYSTAQVKEPKNSLFRISAFRELAKNTRNQTE